MGQRSSEGLLRRAFVFVTENDLLPVPILRCSFLSHPESVAPSPLDLLQMHPTKPIGTPVLVVRSSWQLKNGKEEWIGGYLGA